MLQSFVLCSLRGTMLRRRSGARRTKVDRLEISYGAGSTSNDLCETAYQDARREGCGRLASKHKLVNTAFGPLQRGETGWTQMGSCVVPRQNESLG